MPDRSPLSRRRFLKTAAGASALAAAPYFVPASALGRGGAVPPSERIVVGGIGIQHRGMHDLRWIMGRAVAGIIQQVKIRPVSVLLKLPTLQNSRQRFYEKNIFGR